MSAVARASVAAGRPPSMSPGPGAPPEGTRANTANIRVAECSEATGMESIRPERAQRAKGRMHRLDEDNQS